MVMLILISITILFIWIQSMMSKTTSSNESSFIKEEIVEPVYEAITGKPEVDFDVRKLAHVIEFTVLGLEVSLLFCMENAFLGIAKTYAFCALIAFLDETIQILSNRGPMIQDVWIDLIGVSIGLIVGFISILSHKHLYSNKNKKVEANK